MSYWIEVIKLKIASIAYSIFLWGTNQTHWEFIDGLMDDARREVESDRKTKGYM